MSCREQAAGGRERQQPNRRDFLAGLGAAALIPLVGRRDKLRRIGIQLYTVRREFARDPEGTLAQLAQIGFQEVEFAGYPPGTPNAIRALLDKHRLRAPSSHVDLKSVRTDWERTLDRAATIGQRYVVVAFVGVNERRTLSDWKSLAGEFNRAGEAAAKRGLRFAYHNHDVEFPLLEGEVPYDVLLRETDPKLVSFEMDLYWITKGGKDPLAYFARWPGRFPMVHVKDMDATPRQFFADLGTGTIDFRRIFAKGKQAGIQHYFYEQDETPGDAFASARLAYGYLRSLTY